jgi:Uma2 family endonuclease
MAVVSRSRPQRNKSSRNGIAQIENLEELIHRLGDIPLERILLHPPPGTAKEKDVVAALESPRKRLCELVEGVLVEKPMGAREAIYASVVVRHMDAFAEEHNLGIVLGPDGALRIMVGLVRIPDVSFVPWDWIPGDEWPEDPIPGLVPGLAVEIVSKGNTAKEMETKVGEYFDAGVLVVWLVYPKTQTAEVYSSRTSCRTIDKNGALDGGTLLPGFRLPLKTIFARLRKRRRK